MISLKKYLESARLAVAADAEAEPQDLLTVAVDAYGSMLEEMGHCSQDACPGIGNDLQRALGQLRSELSTAMDCAKLAANRGQAQGRLRDWGRDAARHYRQKACEVKEMLLTMARTAESVSARDERCAGQMKAVTERLGAIASLEDLTEIRASIERSAAELRSSIDRMSEEGKEVLAHLREQVQEYRAKLEEAEQVASRDALTGVSSRVYVESQIERRIEAETAFCVAIVDIDGFKKVNDAHGHLAGDALLKEFAGELRSACRATDVMGRWGGDEFLLLLDGGPAEAEAQTERLRKWVCGNYIVQGRSGELRLRLDASIGLAAHVTGETMKELVARADAAMYQDKAAAWSRVA
jgi:diguanylate cyclase (GGDEF)-like protein